MKFKFSEKEKEASATSLTAYIQAIKPPRKLRRALILLRNKFTPSAKVVFLDGNQRMQLMYITTVQIKSIEEGLKLMSVEDSLNKEHCETLHENLCNMKDTLSDTTIRNTRK